MRQLQILTGRDQAEGVADLAREAGSAAVAILEATDGEGRPTALITATVPNAGLGPLIEQCAEIAPSAQFVFLPTGALALSTPLEDVSRIVRRVEPRSPLELVLGSLQSLGGWQGMLTYSAFSGIVAAYAVLFDLSFLLVAAMLIAPLGAPAMVTVAGAALGDGFMIRRGLIRFIGAVGMLAGTAVLVGLLYGLRVSTTTMETITGLSRWTALIALSGGAAGAAAQIRSSRDSLVTGTATGFLIAVSLSPPAAVLGLALTIQRWDYVGQMALTLVLMYAGIVVGGSIMLLIHGVRPRVTAAHRGSGTVRWVAISIAALMVAGTIIFQSRQGVAYSKADAAHRTLGVIRDAVSRIDRARLVDASADFTRQNVRGGDGETMYVQIVAEPVQADTSGLSESIRTTVGREMKREMPEVVPYIDVSILEPVSDVGGDGPGGPAN